MPAPLVISLRGGQQVHRASNALWNVGRAGDVSPGHYRENASFVIARGIFTAVALRSALSRSRVPECTDSRFLRFMIDSHANPSRIAIPGIRTIPRIRDVHRTKNFILPIDATISFRVLIGTIILSKSKL